MRTVPFPYTCSSVYPLRFGTGEVVATASEMCELPAASLSAVFVAETQ